MHHELIRIHPLDNVAVALEDIPTGETVTARGSTVTARQAIPRGHKLAWQPFPRGPDHQIRLHHRSGQGGHRPRDWVHVHNVAPASARTACTLPSPGRRPAPRPSPDFPGLPPPRGRAAIRNELWVLPTVGCVNAIAQALVRENHI